MERNTKTIKIEDVNHTKVYHIDRSNTRIYRYGCQKNLKRLTKDYKSEKSWLNPE